MISSEDLIHLQRCIELAREALDAGDDPFGSVLVDSVTSTVLQEDRNRINTKGDPTWHPELKLAQWAGKSLTPDQRASAVMYTSGEHCPMCAAAHAWVGLGRIVYVSSASQLARWMAQFGSQPGAVRPLAINDIAPSLRVDGPVPGLDFQVKGLHRRNTSRSA
ncbi:cytidine deaminase-like protein [Hypomontagnella monticulosa]|nr:cytidine deaminase-like protein [Hypomontagnella monticulosa]